MNANEKWDSKGWDKKARFEDINNGNLGFPRKQAAIVAAAGWDYNEYLQERDKRIAAFIADKSKKDYISFQDWQRGQYVDSEGGQCD